MVPPPNSASKKPCGPPAALAAAVYCAPQLFCANWPISARRCPCLIVAAALELFEIADHAVEIAAHLLDLRGDRPALRRQRREQRKKSLAGAAGFVGLRDGAVEVGLLLGDGVFGALDLVGAAGIGGAWSKRRVGLPAARRPDSTPRLVGGRLIRRRLIGRRLDRRRLAAAPVAPTALLRGSRGGRRG